MGKLKQYLLCMMMVLPGVVVAETVYIIDRIQVGIHQDKNLDSPILKLIATGAELELLARDDDMSQIKDNTGIIGWVKNEYLVTDEPTGNNLQELRTQNQKLRAELEQSKETLKELQAKVAQQTTTTGADQTNANALQNENRTLKEQIKSERLKVGELQAQITELRKQMDTGGDGEQLYTRINELEQQKIALENTIAQLKNPSADDAIKDDIINLKSRATDLKKHSYYLLAALIMGLIGGLFLYDIYNRKRHGGFRI